MKNRNRKHGNFNVSFIIFFLALKNTLFMFFLNDVFWNFDFFTYLQKDLTSIF